MKEKDECPERNRSKDGKEDGKEIPNDEEQAVFSKFGSGGVALSNHLVIENISSYLSDRDLDHWYESFGTFKHITDKMDQICWRVRALKLATVLIDKNAKPDENALKLEGKWPKKSYRDIFHILVDKMRAKSNRIPFPEERLKFAASLAYQGLLGPLERLYLEDFLHEINVPKEHMEALVSSATEEVYLMNLWNVDLELILDSVKCKELSIREMDLNHEDTLALVRAMDTRVTEVWLGWLDDPDEEKSPELEDLEDIYIPVTFDIDALTRYEGDGKCSYLVFWKENSFQDYEEDIRSWAKTIYWDVTRDDEEILRMERKTCCERICQSRMKRKEDS